MGHSVQAHDACAPNNLPGQPNLPTRSITQASRGNVAKNASQHFLSNYPARTAYHYVILGLAPQPQLLAQHARNLLRIDCHVVRWRSGVDNNAPIPAGGLVWTGQQGWNFATAQKAPHNHLCITLA